MPTTHNSTRRHSGQRATPSITTFKGHCSNSSSSIPSLTHASTLRNLQPQPPPPPQLLQILQPTPPSLAACVPCYRHHPLSHLLHRNTHWPHLHPLLHHPAALVPPAHPPTRTPPSQGTSLSSLPQTSAHTQPRSAPLGTRVVCVRHVLQGTAPRA